MLILFIPQIVEIKDQEGAYICKRCIADLAVATDFRKRCKTSDELIRDCVGQAERNFWESQELNFDSLNVFDARIKCEDEFRQVIKVEPNIAFHSEEEEEDYNWKFDDYEYPAHHNSSYNEGVLDEDTLKSLKCPFCQKKLNTRRSLKYHIQVKHEPQSSKKYECDVSNQH